MSYGICRRCGRIVPRLSTWPAITTCRDCAQDQETESEAQGETGAEQ